MLLNAAKAIQPVDNTIQLPKHTNDANDHTASIAHDMATLLGQLGAMETFIKRRFDEISMEINATSQQIDMSEDGMAKRFGEILGVMNSISFSGDGSTAANTGVELEAVIADTSKAAHSILDSCDRLNDLLYADDLSARLDQPNGRDSVIEAMRGGIQDIMVACSFQDIAGQRIRKTLENISEIETRITGALEDMGIGPQTLQAAAATVAGEATRSGASQDEIDALFS